MDFLAGLVIIAIVVYLSWRVSDLRRQLDHAQALLEDGETVRRDSADRLVDVPVTMRLHLKQDR